jgi:hypothetical protein
LAEPWLSAAERQQLIPLLARVKCNLELPG